MDSEKQVEHQNNNNNNNNNKKNKKSINKENINSTFIYLDDLINKEIIKIRENPKITNSIKTLRVVNKSLKKINQMISKLLKNKKIDKTSNNNGFMKLNNISNELSKFMNIDENEMKSRVDVTKYICSYIKNNNLQNPEDRREILPDLNLQKLFKINNDKIKYYNIQTLLKIHFPREG